MEKNAKEQIRANYISSNGAGKADIRQADEGISGRERHDRAGTLGADRQSGLGETGGLAKRILDENAWGNQTI